MKEARLDLPVHNELTPGQIAVSCACIAAAFLLLLARPLDKVFRRLECAISVLTGVAPRHDDRRYEMRYRTPATRQESHCAP